jgi:hypothetical protein
MALSVSHPLSTRDQYHPESFISRDDIGQGLIRDVIRKEQYHIMFIIYKESLVLYYEPLVT